MSKQAPATEELEAVKQSRVINNFLLALRGRRRIDETDYTSVYCEGGSREFWENYLFGVTSIDDLIYTLSLAGSPNWESIEISETNLGKAFLEAYQSDENWFQGRYEELQNVNYFHQVENPRLIKVICRKAVEWLNRNPYWRHLVPDTLRSFLSLDAMVAEAAGGLHALNEPRPDGVRGRRPKKRNAVVQKMYEQLREGMTLETLRGMKQEALASMFEASRETCRKARGEVLKARGEVLSGFAAD